jgi:hypothetical protein
MKHKSLGNMFWCFMDEIRDFRIETVTRQSVNDSKLTMIFWYKVCNECGKRWPYRVSSGPVV